ncbi:MAG: general secretion pathway protein GspK [Planctomycetaceae bacterium]|nr:general secretion pathway protein GspK [Planctomycetaceae bacterium]
MMAGTDRQLNSGKCGGLPAGRGKRLRVKRMRRGGMVLFIVVIFVTLLSLAGLSYVALMSTEHKAVRLRGDELQVEMAVGSGAEMMCAHLQQKSKPATSTIRANRSASDESQFRGVVVMDDDTGRRTRFSIVAPKIEDDRVTGIRFGMSNESARLNLAVLPEWDERVPGSARAALMTLPNMSQSIADAILDWVDRDTTARQFGAEASYYAGLNVPYGPRNAEPTSLEELLLVRDVTRDLLFGADENCNYQIDAGEQSQASSGTLSSAGAAEIPWSMLLTVFSAEKNLNPDGGPKIDLNERDLASLHAKLAKVVDADLAKFIILCRQYRQVNPESSPGRNVSLSRVELDFSVRGRYPFASVLDLLGAAVEIRASDEARTRQTIRSPMTANSQVFRETLPALLDQVSIGGDRVIRGRINLLEASEDVLVAVPGVTEELARRITTQRQVASSGDGESRRHPTWLLADGLVDLAQMKSLLPYVTCGGDVYRAQIVGFFDEQGPVSRAEVVIDATSVPARQVYYKDLRLLGRGFSIDALRGTTAGVPEPLEAPKPLEAAEWE